MKFSYGAARFCAFAALLSLAEFVLADTLLITNVNLWDGTSDEFEPGMNVLIEDEVFEKISATDIVAPGAQVVDGEGMYLMPGFIDLHTHFMLHDGPPGWRKLDSAAHGALAAYDMKQQLEQGFTTTRGAGSDSRSLGALVKMGKIVGPRHLSSGPWIGPTGGHGDFGFIHDAPDDMDYMEKAQQSFVVDGRAEVLEATRSVLRGGATQIKLMLGGGLSSEFDPLWVNEFTLDEIKAAVEIAEDYTTYAMAHVYTDAGVNRAIDGGVKVIEHGFLSGEKTFKRMAKEGVAWSFQAFAAVGPVCEPEKIGFWNADQKKKALEICVGAKKSAAAARKAGVLIGLGGDLFGPVGMPSINENMVVPVTKFGFTEIETLKMATSNAAQIVEMAGEMNPYKAHKLGVIQTGAWGDAVLLDGNPMEDITRVRPEHILMVVKGGVIYKDAMN
ncbi:amidohydrolase family protein [Congregibacter brevis]|uniref:Amidohydrolase family protein n=1 Tax=Congregibacter brevis TaxID=3081201 RepID=A0ABZ0I905_9GAMM|nr:amidohydrolase family protein [Congregibacter sp. IMCC45268]